MDLTYPADAEEFRGEIRAWLDENLPDGWFDDGFEMSDDERARFNREWPRKLFEGGGQFYGPLATGKGLAGRRR